MNAGFKTLKDPRLFIGLTWPLVLVVPYLPGIPKPSLGGLAWKQELAFAILLVVTLAFLIRRKRQMVEKSDINLPSPSLLIPALLFVFWISASTLWAENPYSAGHYAFTWGAYVLFFVLMRLVTSHPRSMRRSFYALGIVVWLLSLSCLIEWLAGAALTDHSFRQNVKPLMRGFSGFGETMAVAAPIFGMLALSIRRRREAILCGATSCIAWMVILQSNQRAPIFAATAAFLVVGLGLIVFKRCRPLGVQRVGLLAAGLIVVAFLQIAVFSEKVEHQQTLFERVQSTSTSDTNTRARFLYWGVGLEMFRAHPFIGVGANNYQVAFPSAREQFATAHPNSALVGMNEQLLTQYAHNEYVQLLAELGMVGMLLFGALCLLLVRDFWRALRNSVNPSLALGAGAGLFAFALSSGASAFSFRWFGSGLMCFFAAAIVSHLAESKPAEQQINQQALLKVNMWQRLRPAAAFAFAFVMLIGASMQAMNGVTHAWAETSETPAQAETFYRQALRFNSFDAATHFDYGSLLYQQRRYEEAVTHLQYAVGNGFNTSTSYAALAAAQEGAGNPTAAERTLAVASQAYPRSIFIRVRHAAALSRLGQHEESDKEFGEALALDSRAARGWYQLINFDIDAALVAAQQDSSLAKPGELEPQNAIYVVLKENERRLNIPAKSGWRGRVGALSN